MIDLHVHSDISDGSDSIEDILRLAKSQGIHTLSFVDHDTTETYYIAKPLAEKFGITVIPGIEISAYDFTRNRKVHVLGYNYKQTTHIDKLVKPLLEMRHKHSLKQLEAIKEAGYTINEKMIDERIKKGVLYKQHIMQALTYRPFMSQDYQNLYQSIFKKGVAKGDITYVDVRDALTAIKKDDGITVIAHPGQLDSYDCISEIMETEPSLIDGIETFHYDHSEIDIKRASHMVKRYDLIETGGSDYHGDFGTDHPIGYYITSLSNFNKIV